ncbi:hypothetical protein [Azospirillum doebereinerae]
MWTIGDRRPGSIDLGQTERGFWKISRTSRLPGGAADPRFRTR